MSKKVRNPRKPVASADNSAMENAFDVLGMTNDGKTIVAEAKNIGPRVQALRELAHDTIMDLTKSTRWYKQRFYTLMTARRKLNKPAVKHPFDLFKAAKPVLKEIAVNGGDSYKSTTMTLQYTWSSDKTLTETVDLILG